MALALDESERDTDSLERGKPGLPPQPPGVAAQVTRDKQILADEKRSTREANRQSIDRAKSQAKERSASARRNRKHLKAVIKANEKIAAAQEQGGDTTALTEARSRLCEQYGKHTWYGGAPIHPATCRVCGVFSDREQATRNERGHYERGTQLLEKDGFEYVHDGAGGSYPVAQSYEGRYTVYLLTVQETATRRHVHPFEMIAEWAQSEDFEPPWVLTRGAGVGV